MVIYACCQEFITRRIIHSNFNIKSLIIYFGFLKIWLLNKDLYYTLCFWCELNQVICIVVDCVVISDMHFPTLNCTHKFYSIQILWICWDLALLLLTSLYKFGYIPGILSFLVAVFIISASLQKILFKVNFIYFSTYGFAIGVSKLRFFTFLTV